MARMNVYVPDGLAEVLQQFRDDISVSAVLREALEPRLAEQIQRMNDVARAQLFAQLSEAASTQVSRILSERTSVVGMTLEASSPRLEARAAARLVADFGASSAPPRVAEVVQGAKQAPAEQREGSKAAPPRFGFGDFLPQPATTEEVGELRQELAELRKQLEDLRRKVDGVHSGS